MVHGFNLRHERLGWNRSIRCIHSIESEKRARLVRPKAHHNHLRTRIAGRAIADRAIMFESPARLCQQFGRSVFFDGRQARIIRTLITIVTEYIWRCFHIVTQNFLFWSRWTWATVRGAGLRSSGKRVL